MENLLNRFFNHLMTLEGGNKLVNNPKDPGGLTKFGISKRAYPDEDIENLTLARVRELFLRDYWKPCYCDELPEAVAIVVCDTAFNCGKGIAIKFLQQLLGLKADGIIGPKTLDAISKIENDFHLLKSFVLRYTNLRISYYQSLPTWKTFGKGWVNRANSILIFAYKFLPENKDA